MKILKFNEINIVEDFLTNVFIETITESSEILEDTYLSKLQIHKKILDTYKDIIPALNNITISLIKNSSLKIDLNTFNVTLFSLASLSNTIEKKSNEHQRELRSILEELKLNGIGNNLVENLSKFYSMIFEMSSKLFNKKNLLNAVNDYIKKNKITFDTFISKFSNLSKLIMRYMKSGKLNLFKNKIGIITDSKN